MSVLYLYNQLFYTLVYLLFLHQRLVGKDAFSTHGILVASVLCYLTYDPELLIHATMLWKKSLLC